MDEAISSITKNKQPFSILSKLVQTYFNQTISEQNVKELNGGYCNAIYEIAFENTQLPPVILKIAPTPQTEMMQYEEGLLQTEVEVLKLIEDKTSIKAPKVLFYDTSCTLCNAPFFFMTKIPGQTVNTLPKQVASLQEKIDSTIGNYLKQLNGIEGNKFGICNCPQTFSKTNKDFILKIFQMLLTDGIKKQCDLRAINYEDLSQLLLTNADIFEGVDKPHLVHWDLWEGNVFINNNEVSGIIDFERALWGDPLMEQTFSSFLKPSPSFLKAYGKTQFTPKELVRCQFYKIYRELGMIIECPYRDYKSEAQYMWVTGELKKDIPLVKRMLLNYRSLV